MENIQEEINYLLEDLYNSFMGIYNENGIPDKIILKRYIYQLNDLKDYFIDIEDLKRFKFCTALSFIFEKLFNNKMEINEYSNVFYFLSEHPLFNKGLKWKLI